MAVQVMQNVGRRSRTPTHTFQVRHIPFGIQPFFIAPVLAGETMKNLLFQSRAVSDPIRNPLVGWWLEYYFFYVKLTDLDARDTIMNALIDPTNSMSSLNEAANIRYYHAAGGPNWTKLCLKRVVEEYFRDEGDAWDIFKVDTDIPQAMLQGETWQNSLMTSAALVSNDFNVDLNANETITASEIERAWSQWQLLKSGNLVDMSWEDYLRTFGVKPPEEASHRPELIRYVREWTYPTNHIDPTNGAATSAVSWGIQERADKDRFFKEPGFLFGVTVARPKVYSTKQTGSAVELMENAYAWLPAALRSDANASLVRNTGTNSVLTGLGATEYVVDMKDLLLYGDQFLNFDATASNVNASQVGLPTNDLSNIRFVPAADINGLFVSVDVNRVRQDGVVRLSILGAQTETSPRGSPGIVL